MNKIRIAGAAAGVVLVSGMVLQVSSAAFTDTTDNAANSWDAGTVAIENDAGSAMFASTAQAPGDTEEKCLMVSYSGTVTPQSIKLTAAVTPDPATTADDASLADNLLVEVDMGDPGSTCDDMFASTILGVTTPAEAGTNVFSGTLEAFDTATADTLWTPQALDEGTPADMTRAFRFTVTLDPGTGNDAQGDGADATFTWSASS